MGQSAILTFAIAKPSDIFSENHSDRASVAALAPVNLMLVLINPEAAKKAFKEMRHAAADTEA